MTVILRIRQPVDANCINWLIGNVKIAEGIVT